MSSAERRRARVDVRTGRPFVVTTLGREGVRVLRRRLVRSGELWDLHSERWDLEGRGKGSVGMRAARNKSGDYIGDERDGRELCDRRGIAPELRTSESCVCSIGRSQKDGRWYGWSHRAIHGFAVGDVLTDGDLGVGADGVAPGEIATEEHARAAACAFAASVS